MSEDEDEDTKRIRTATRFLHTASYFIAATAKQHDLEVLIIVTDKHTRPAICMASSLEPEKQPQLVLDVLLQMSGGTEHIEELVGRMSGSKPEPVDFTVPTGKSKP